MRGVATVCFMSITLIAIAGALFGQAAAPDRAAEARAAAQAYLDAFLATDADRMDRLFHADWRMSAMLPDGAYRAATRSEYLEGVRAAAARESRREYAGRIANVTVQGRAAVALLEIESDEALFHEFISMLRADEGWRVVQKVVAVERKE